MYHLVNKSRNLRRSCSHIVISKILDNFTLGIFLIIQSVCRRFCNISNVQPPVYSGGDCLQTMILRRRPSLMSFYPSFAQVSYPILTSLMEMIRERSRSAFTRVGSIPTNSLTTASSTFSPRRSTVGMWNGNYGALPMKPPSTAPISWSL